MRKLIIRALAPLVILPVLVPAQTTKPVSLPRMNLTGTWEGGFLGGAGFQLFQDGDRVWGKFTYGNGNGFARGSWSEGRLILILTPTTARIGGACDARKIVAVTSKGTATLLEPYVLDLAGNTSYTAKMRRTSPSPGPAVEYPYEAELKNCGQLFTYDLTFDTNSDKLKGADWPILEVVAGLLKKDPALKIQIGGHSDSTGNPDANLNLSQRRAETVKKALSERYGADAGRITAKGYGAEQPLAPIDTDEGKSINRRVEIVLDR
jgi:outer membrane protein OmpA-like peptidoglycan-associated protein